ncbi:hypothetical protein RKLH11_3285 [Rhodobacteraceae bacterium KLH11]|nr:hypothetical protein RKLH11_3285 [Rhodobacteraceae bacterium KLH11]
MGDPDALFAASRWLFAPQRPCISPSMVCEAVSHNVFENLCAMPCFDLPALR